MRGVWDILFARQMAIHYVSPPVCEVIFSGSSNPVIILSEPTLTQVTGLVIGGFGGFQLTWNAFPGAICYNVYYIGGDNIAVLLAQCITDPFFELPPGLDPGEIIVTAITSEGETPPSEPVQYPTGGGGGGTDTVFVISCPSTSRASFPGSFTFQRDFTIGSTTINFTLSGTAINGTDYETIATSVTFPNGVSTVTIDIIPIEAVLIANKSVILTIDEATNYAVGSPASATVVIRVPVIRVKNYGTIAAPLFIPAPTASKPGQPALSDGCEWDGTFNYVVGPYPTGESTYYYRDTDGNFTGGVNESIQGTQVLQILLIGPYPPIGSPLILFQVQILGELDDGTPYAIWQGYKTQAEGGDASGVYQIAGSNMSDLRPTVEFELFP